MRKATVVLIFLVAAALGGQVKFVSAVYEYEAGAIDRIKTAYISGDVATAERIISETAEFAEQYKNRAQPVLAQVTSLLAAVKSGAGSRPDAEELKKMRARLVQIPVEAGFLGELEADILKMYAIDNRADEAAIVQLEKERMKIRAKAEAAIAGKNGEITRLEAESAALKTKAEKAIVAEKLKIEAAKKADPKADVAQNEAFIAHIRRQIDDYRNYIKGDYGIGLYEKDEGRKKARADIELWQRQLDSDGATPADPWDLPLYEVRGAIAKKRQELADRARRLRTGEYLGFLYIEQKRQELGMERLRLEYLTGTKKERVSALEAQEKALRDFIAHDFRKTVVIPKKAPEPSYWEELKGALVTAAADLITVSEAAGEIISLADPVKLANRVLTYSTGQGMAELVAGKLLPKDWVKPDSMLMKALNGEYSRAALVREAALKAIPLGVLEAYDQLKLLREDPEAFAKDKASAALRQKIASEPALKAAMAEWASIRKETDPKTYAKSLVATAEKRAKTLSGITDPGLKKLGQAINSELLTRSKLVF